MTLSLPRPPSAELFRADPQRWAAEINGFFNRLVGELERESRVVGSPAKAVFQVSNIAAPTTTLDGGTATLGDTLNFIGGLVDTLNNKGILRTKAGTE